MNKDIHQQANRQRASQQLVSDYMRFLIDQETLVEHVLERRLAECLPELEVTIANHIINQLKTVIK